MKDEGVRQMAKVRTVAERAFAAREARRRRSAALPIAEKVRILVQMQEMAAPLLKAQGREVVVWKIGGEG